MIADAVKHFREALGKRGELNSSSYWERYLAEVEYPLDELQKYWAGTGSLGPRAAAIFVYFVRDKAVKLREFAAQLDDEYSQSEATDEKWPRGGSL